jgi:hypothetical protein
MEPTYMMMAMLTMITMRSEGDKLLKISKKWEGVKLNL